MKTARLLGVVAAVVLVAGLLSACQQRVGAAAFVGSTRISESDVNKYLTANITPTTDSNGQAVSPKSLVLGYVIAGLVFNDIARTTPGGPITATELANARTALLQNSSVTEDQFRADEAKAGYSGAYAGFYIDVLARFAVISARLKDDGSGSSILAAIDKLKVKIKVSPRYGTWNPATLTVKNGPTVPSYLKLDTGATTAGVGSSG